MMTPTKIKQKQNKTRVKQARKRTTIERCPTARQQTVVTIGEQQKRMQARRQKIQQHDEKRLNSVIHHGSTWKIILNFRYM